MRTFFQKTIKTVKECAELDITGIVCDQMPSKWGTVKRLTKDCQKHHFQSFESSEKVSLMLYCIYVFIILHFSGVFFL